LFDITAFPGHKSIYNAPPVLTISNCEFEYFLADYDTLINVNTNNIINETYKQYYTDSNKDWVYANWTFYTYEGGESGAKIYITNSTFKHSSFSKGLVTYRKQPYISDVFGFENYTYHYMIDPYVGDSGSYIILESSIFYNLNFL
jgi:hypothetical protein